jgi:phenylalanyl-tRNA synthetase beta chain
MRAFLSYTLKKSACIFINGKNIGFIGEIHPQIYEDYKISQEVFFCEIDLSLFENKMLEQSKESFVIPSKFPSTTRDFAFILDKKTPALTLIKEMEEISDLIKKVTLVDLYQDSKLMGKKSLAFSITIQSEEKTLVEEEISLLSQKIISLIQNKYQAQLRDK